MVAERTGSLWRVSAVHLLRRAWFQWLRNVGDGSNSVLVFAAESGRWPPSRKAVAVDVN